MLLNTRKFLNVAVRIAFQSASIIEEIHKSNKMGEQWKGIDDPVTKADLQIQKMINETFHEFWPTLRIIGEETLHDNIQSKKMSHIEIDSELSHQPYLPIDEDLPIDEVCVWVDPLDGTLSYTQNYLHEVSTLIGLSCGGRARLGVIGLPYGHHYPYEYKPRVVFGDARCPQVYKIGADRVIKYIRKRNMYQDFTITTSRVDSDANCRLLSKASPNILKYSGAGKKMYQVVAGHADAMVYFGNRCSKWDTCAGEALVEALGGRTSDIVGRRVEYDPSMDHYYNENSVVSTLDERHRDRIMHAINNHRFH